MEVRKIAVECYTRVVGYFRPVTQTNPGKLAEISDRKHFDANKYADDVLSKEDFK